MGISLVSTNSNWVLMSTNVCICNFTKPTFHSPTGLPPVTKLIDFENVKVAMTLEAHHGRQLGIGLGISRQVLRILPVGHEHFQNEFGDFFVGRWRRRILSIVGVSNDALVLGLGDQGGCLAGFDVSSGHGGLLVRDAAVVDVVMTTVRILCGSDEVSEEVMG